MNLNNNKETPDYGEPWKIENTETETWVSATNWTRDQGDIACKMGDDNPLSLKHWPARARRIVQCVNACAGMADPAAELAAMREAIKEVAEMIDQIPHAYDSRFFRAGQWADTALTKLQPFIK